MVKNKRAARAARTLKQFRAFSSKQQLEITIFAYTPSICFIQQSSNTALPQLIIEGEQAGIIAK